MQSDARRGRRGIFEVGLYDLAHSLAPPIAMIGRSVIEILRCLVENIARVPQSYHRAHRVHTELCRVTRCLVTRTS
jgi:hypothetical protein